MIVPIEYPCNGCLNPNPMPWRCEVVDASILNEVLYVGLSPERAFEAFVQGFRCF